MESDIPREDSTKILHKIVPIKEVNQLAVRSDVEGLKQLLFHLGCIFCTGYLIRYTSLYSCKYCSLSHHHNLTSYVAAVLFYSAIILHGFILSFLFMPLHECVHKTAFKSNFLNNTVGILCGVAALRKPFYYYYYHFPHHRFTGDPERDPELQDTLIDMKLNTISNYLLYLSGIPYWIYFVVSNYNHATGNANEPWLRNDRIKQNVVLESRILMAFHFTMLLLCVFGGYHAIWYYWYLPSLLGQVRIFLAIIRCLILNIVFHIGSHFLDSICLQNTLAVKMVLIC